MYHFSSRCIYIIVLWSFLEQLYCVNPSFRSAVDFRMLSLNRSWNFPMNLKFWYYHFIYPLIKYCSQKSDFRFDPRFTSFALQSSVVLYRTAFTLSIYHLYCVLEIFIDRSASYVLICLSWWHKDCKYVAEFQRKSLYMNMS